MESLDVIYLWLPYFMCNFLEKLIISILCQKKLCLHNGIEVLKYILLHPLVIQQINFYYGHQYVHVEYY